MRLLAAIGIIGLCIASAAIAQEWQQQNFTAEWDRRPTGRTFSLNYPDHAVSTGTPGMVVLCCMPRSDRTLECHVGLEWPQDWGFGEATLEIAEAFRMSETSYAEFQSTPGAWLQVPIGFRMQPSRRDIDVDEVFEQIRERSVGLCRPTQPTPAPES